MWKRGGIERMRELWFGGLVAALLVSGPTAAQEQAPAMSWQDAIGQLASERTRGEVCVAMLKRFAPDDLAALARGELAYTEAKAEFDGVISGLAVALAQAEPPESMATLQSRLERGVAEREALCAEALAFAPQEDGARSAILALVGEALGPLIEAATAIYKDQVNRGILERETIRTQLEATRWPTFGSIEP